jgi:hypothetical protein
MDKKDEDKVIVTAKPAQQQQEERKTTAASLRKTTSVPQPRTTKVLVVTKVPRRDRTPPQFRGLAVINAAYVTLKDSDDLSVVETAPVGTRLARVMATDEARRGEIRLTFAVEDEAVHNLRSPKRHVEIERQHESKKGHFRVDASSGDLILLRKLSPALKYLLNVSISDASNLKTVVTLKISVEDVNDKKPHFDQRAYRFTVEEGRFKRLIKEKLQKL